MAKLGLSGADLIDLANNLVRSGPRKIQSTSRRVRVVLNGATIIDTTRARHVWEHDYFPQYYVPVSALRNCEWVDLESTQQQQQQQQQSSTVTEGSSSIRGMQVKLTVPATSTRKAVETDRVLRFVGEPSGDANTNPLANLVRLEFSSMDTWLEDDMPIHVHPKDPYKRLDLLPSSRPVEVRVHGQTVAESPSSVHLLETGLPTRYYMPLASVDPSLLVKSDLVTHCPYKGDAEYYHLVVDGETVENVVWYYRYPTVECATIAGLICFYNEKVDIFLDGERLEKPKTPFS